MLKFFHSSKQSTDDSPFRQSQPYEKRCQESNQIRAKYPDCVPIIVEKANNNRSLPDIDRIKFLTPGDLTVGQFLWVIRKRTALSADKALFLYVNNTLPPSSALISHLDASYRNEDGYLYVQYAGENTFG